MKSLRTALSRLLTVGLLNDGWYSILTGLVLLLLAWELGGVAWDVDPAAQPVALAFLIVGGWQLARGLRAELPRRTRPTDDSA